MSARKRRDRESAQHEMLAEFCAEIAHDLEVAGQKTAASVFRKRGQLHAAEANRG